MIDESVVKYVHQLTEAFKHVSFHFRPWLNNGLLIWTGGHSGSLLPLIMVLRCELWCLALVGHTSDFSPYADIFGFW